MSVHAYRRVMRDTVTPRDSEKQILSRLTFAMESHQRAYADADALGRLRTLEGGLRQALSDNLKFWTAVRLDLMSPENTFTAALRANLISLSVFVEKTTATVMGGGGGLRALISTNHAIIAGLSGVSQPPAGLTDIHAPDRHAPGPA